MTVNRFAAAIVSGVMVAGLAVSAAAQDETAQDESDAAAMDGRVTLELNKLEQVDQTCRAYMLFENDSGSDFDQFRLDLVLFDAEGVISRRIAIEAAPLETGRSTVKFFDFTEQQCDTIDRMLVNGVSPCADASGEREDCNDILNLANRTDVDFYQ
ncbi:MAG: Tat pathway signal sequence domain protein [Pseudomonadota bacterium]